MLDPRQEAVYTTWRQEAAGRKAVPPRDAFDPVHFPGALSTLVLVERTTDESLYIRLMGTDIVAAWGRDFTGYHLHEVLSGEYHIFVRDLFDDCIRRRVPLYSHSRLQWHEGMTLDTCRLLLPYVRNEALGEIGFVLMSQVFSHGKSGPAKPIVMAGDNFALIECQRQVLPVEVTPPGE